MSLKNTNLKVLTNPKVSVICGTFNAMGFIDNLIASLRAQTYPHWECIFVDDGSTDGTRDYLLALVRSDGRFVLCEKEPEGSPARSRNVGIRQAKGTLIAFCDHDDFWAPQKLEFQIAAWRQVPNASIIHTARTVWTLRSLPESWPQFRPPQQFTVQSFDEALLTGCRITHSSVMVTKQRLFEIGLLHPDLRGVDDYHAFLKLGLRGSIVRLEQPLTYYYWHEGNLSHAGRIFIDGLRQMVRIMAAEAVPRRVIRSVDAQATKSEAVLNLVNHPLVSLKLCWASLQLRFMFDTFKVATVAAICFFLPKAWRLSLVEHLRGEGAVGDLNSV